MVHACKVEGSYSKETREKVFLYTVHVQSVTNYQRLTSLCWWCGVLFRSLFSFAQAGTCIRRFMRWWSPAHQRDLRLGFAAEGPYWRCVACGEILAYAPLDGGFCVLTLHSSVVCDSATDGCCSFFPSSLYIGVFRTPGGIFWLTHEGVSDVVPFLGGRSV